VSGTITGRHVRTRHGAPVTRGTHGDGFDPAARTGASDLYGGALSLEQVTRGGIAPGSVDGDLLQNGTIEETHIADDSISTPKLQANAVTADKITAGAITAREMKISSGTNLVHNGSFEEYEGTLPIDLLDNATVEASLPGWKSLSLGTGSSIALFAAPSPFHGSNVIEIAQSATVTNVRLHTHLIPVLEGEVFRARARACGTLTNPANAFARLVVTFFDADEAQLSSVGLDSTNVGTSTTWVQLSADVTAPAGSAFVRYSIENQSTSDISAKVYFDACELHRKVRDVQNDAATVTIDETGITIEDGALILKDEFDTTVAGAGGFSGGWADYVRTGLYNGNMSVGATGALSFGRNSHLPYWTSSQQAGSPSLTGLSGGGVECRWSAVDTSLRLLSDSVEVTGGQYYFVALVLQFDVASGSPLLICQPYIQWLDSAGSTISTTTLDAHSAGGDVARAGYNSAPVVAPTTAVRAKVRLDLDETLAHNAANFIRVYAVTLLPAPPENLVGQDILATSITVDNVFVGAAIGGDFDGQGFTIGGRLKLSGIIGPTALGGNTDNWNPAGLATANVIRISSSGAVNLTGIVAQEDNTLILLTNINASNAITLVHDLTSTAVNRFFCPGNANFTLSARRSVWLWYDGASDRWRVVA
jgi:hypothetical protein